MRLVVLFGPPAVGKMTVGLALSRLTGFPLFHNHVTIEAVHTVFPFAHAAFWPLVTEFRRRMFEEAVAHGVPGLIFTNVWALDDPSDKDYVDRFAEIVERQGGTTYFAELTAPLEVRMRRNEHEGRLAAKATKRDVVASRAFLLRAEAEHTMNTDGRFFYPDRHIRIDNADLSPDEAADKIVTAFRLPTSSENP